MVWEDHLERVKFVRNSSINGEMCEKIFCHNLFIKFKRVQKISVREEFCKPWKIEEHHRKIDENQ